MDKLVIAEVLKPQGIRGELKIKTFTDFPEDVKAFKMVYIDDIAYKILSFRVGTDGAAYIGLRGIPDRNAAELFRGKLLKGDRDDAPALNDGQYYIVDIIGLSCETEDGEVLGIVKDISNFHSLITKILNEPKYYNLNSHISHYPKYNFQFDVHAANESLEQNNTVH